MYLEAVLLFFNRAGWRVKHLLLAKTALKGMYSAQLKSFMLVHTVMYDTYDKCCRTMLGNNITPQIPCTQQKHSVPMKGWQMPLTSICQPSISLQSLRATCKACYLISFWFLPLSLTQHSGFHYHFIVYLWRLGTGEVTVIITDRTKTALFPVGGARSQELRGQAANRELMPIQQLTCNTDNTELVVYWR